jgi:hypothetical protein
MNISPIIVQSVPSDYVKIYSKQIQNFVTIVQNSLVPV